MKKMLAVLLALMTVLSVSVLFASADETAEVYVTIADKDGKLAVAAEKVTVTDIDGDKALTINDTLYAAHEKFYEGGAAAGFGTELTEKYGLSLTKLWGEANGGSYGYMVNNASAWSMTDPVKTDDYVAAYVFTDTKTFADKYAYFDKFKADVCAGFDLTLTKADYDAEWNPITVKIAGAEITVDGEPTGIFTDENGVASVSFKTDGKHIVSATAAGQVIVPPVCVAEVTGCPAATPDEAAVAPTEESTEAIAPTTAPTTAPTVAPTTPKSSSSPKTADETHVLLWIVVMLACMGGACATLFVYKKRNEK